jgi:RNA polymerase sigma-70 factor (ECF subfamily)
VSVTVIADARIVRGCSVSLNPNPLLLNLHFADRSALIKCATGIVDSRARAEDIVQDAYVHVASIGRTDRLSVDSNRQSQAMHPVGDPYRAECNLVAGWSRRPLGERGEPADVVDTMAAQSPEPELINRWQVQLLAEALAELPERTQIAFAMHRFGGHTLQTIAEHLGISVTLAHQLVRNALTHFAERLDQSGS